MRSSMSRSAASRGQKLSEREAPLWAVHLCQLRRACATCRDNQVESLRLSGITCELALSPQLSLESCERLGPVRRRATVRKPYANRNNSCLTAILDLAIKR